MVETVVDFFPEFSYTNGENSQKISDRFFVSGRRL